VDRRCAALILTHGRPDRVHTLRSLRRCGYTGRVVLVLDNEDKTIDEYRTTYPDEEIVVFDKEAVSNRIDNYTNAGDRRAIVYARNAAFDIARDLGLDAFVQLDDDYTTFEHRVGPASEYLTAGTARDLDAVFDAMFDFLYESGATSVALAQGGDMIGAGGGMSKLPDGRYKNSVFTKMKRKAMNSFFCRTDRPFEFSGRINEDVNAYVGLGRTGALFATVAHARLTQVTTQASDGGMSDIYRDGGTFVKSFYTVLANPSCVRVELMGAVNPRLHHSIDWKCAVPKIVRAQNQTKQGKNGACDRTTDRHSTRIKSGRKKGSSRETQQRG